MVYVCSAGGKEGRQRLDTTSPPFGELVGARILALSSEGPLFSPEVRGVLAVSKQCKV